MAVAVRIPLHPSSLSLALIFRQTRVIMDTFALLMGITKRGAALTAWA